MSNLEYDSYTGELVEGKNTKKGGKAGRKCGYQDHVMDASTQAIEALESSWDLGYFAKPGLKTLLLLGELKDIAECRYNLVECNPSGDRPDWKYKRKPKEEWEPTLAPEDAERRISDILSELRRIS